MARGFRMGGAGGGGEKEKVIYDNGSWGVPYDNPGSWSGATTGATLNATSVSVTSTSSNAALIATSNLIDLSNYTMVKILAHNTGQATPQIAVTDAKDTGTSHILARTVLPLNSAYTEYVVDVTNVSSGYIVVNSAASYSRTCEFTKIWLE